MRELKFRAWDKELNCWMKEPMKDPMKELMINFYSNSGMPIFIFDQPGIYSIEKSGRYIIQQYTGLKDKNGVEIYEGDIIKGGSTYPLEVYWMGLAWGVRWEDMGNEEESIICDDGGDLSLQENALIFTEVVGNIYENPEFLTPLSEDSNEAK